MRQCTDCLGQKLLGVRKIDRAFYSLYVTSDLPPVAIPVFLTLMQRVAAIAVEQESEATVECALNFSKPQQILSKAIRTLDERQSSQKM